MVLVANLFLNNFPNIHKLRQFKPPMLLEYRFQNPCAIQNSHAQPAHVVVSLSGSFELGKMFYRTTSPQTKSWTERHDGQIQFAGVNEGTLVRSHFSGIISYLTDENQDFRGFRSCHAALIAKCKFYPIRSSFLFATAVKFQDNSNEAGRIEASSTREFSLVTELIRFVPLGVHVYVIGSFCPYRGDCL